MGKLRQDKINQRLKESAHKLAMYVLQNEVYRKDLDIQNAVNDVLTLTMDK